MAEDEGEEDVVEAEEEVVAATGIETMKEVAQHQDKTIVGRNLLRHLRKMQIITRRSNFIY